MQVLLLLVLASASTVFGKSLAASNLLLADEGAAHFDIDQPNFDLRFAMTPNDRMDSDGNRSEADQDAIGESSETDLAGSHEILEDEPSNHDNGEKDEHLLTSGEWQQRMNDDSEEENSYGHYSRYDYNPSWWRTQGGPIVVQPIVIPVQFAFRQQDYFRRRILY